MEDTIRQKSFPKFLSGGGEMGERVRNFDWEETPTGPIDNWPESLRSAVSICLNSNFPIAIYWGKDLTLIYNDAWSPIPGNKHPWALGRGAKEVWPEIWDVLKPQFEKAFKGEPGGSTDALLPMQRHGYVEECYFDFTFTPIYGSEGKVEGVFNAVIETTYRIINERQLQTLHQLGSLCKKDSVEEIYSASATVIEKNNKDFPFAVLYAVNEDGSAAEQVAWAGIGARESVFPNSIDILNPKEGTYNFCTAFNQNKILLSENNGRRTNLPRGAWEKEPTHFIHIPITSQGRKFPFAILTTAINPFRKFDESFHRFAQLIADQISTEVNNVRAINEERKRAKALTEIDKAKTLFFNNISHEFRTPLTLILGSLEELLNKKQSGNNNIELIGSTHRNAMRLLRLVNTLLDFSRIEAGRVNAQFELTDIAIFTTNVASNFRSVIEAAGISFDIKCDRIIQPVYLDKEMWEKIVLNLLSNAFKYTLEGNISVTLNVEENNVVLRIKDTGVGIPENELPKIFERFHRVQKTVGRSYEGTGIGLALVSELVKLHSGEITVKSQEHEGTEFTVSIPIGRHHLPEKLVINEPSDFRSMLTDTFIQEASALIDETDSKNNIYPENHLPTLLIVDDNADMRAYIKTLLQDDYHIITAANGMNALHQIREHSPQLIVSDIMMPVMDGLQLLKTLKEDPKTESIPIILLSARAGEESRIEGYETGADDYLIKPFSAKELKARVGSQLKIKRTRNHIHQQMRNLFLQAPVAIAVLRGPELIVELANEKALELAGRTEEELLHKPLFKANPYLAGQGFEEIFENVYKTGERIVSGITSLKLLRNAKREEIFAKNIYQPLHQEDGTIIGIMCVSIDVTEEVKARRKIEETELRVRIAVESGQLGTFEIDILHSSIIFSERLAVIFGLDPSKKGSYDDLKKALHPDDVAMRNKAHKEALETGTLHYEARVVWKNGFIHWVRVHGKVKFENGEAKRIYGIAEDITEEKKRILELKESEQRIQILNEHLSYELSATKELQKFSTKFIYDRDINKIFEELLESAMRLMKSDFASIQLYDSEKEELVLYGSKNFHPQSEAFWKKVKASSGSTCGEALKNKQRIVVNNVEEARFMKGTEDLEYYRLSDIRAVQSTPLISRNGKFIGMISTHWKEVHDPSPNDLKFFDILTRQASDIIEQKRAADQLRYAATLTQNIADAVIGTSIFDEGYLITSWNKGAEEIYGYMQEEVLGKPAIEIIPAELVSETDKLSWEKSLNSAGHWQGEVVQKRKDGSSINILASIALVKNENGEPIGTVGVNRDNTKRKKAEQQLLEYANRIKIILESLPQIAWTTDSKGSTDYFNAKWYEFTGLTESESMGTGWTQIIHPDDASRVATEWNNAITCGSAIEMEFRIRSADGKYKWHFGVGVPQHNNEGEITSWTGTSTNIDEQKLNEQKKDEFISVASHEMKTPLTTANAYIQLLEMSLNKENNMAITYAKRAGSSLKRLNELITELLDVSKIKNGKINYNITTFDFDEMIDRTVENSQHASPSHLIIKTGNIHQQISGDKERLQQVVINLLSNAIKYSPGAEKVFINVEKSESEIKVIVKDKGIGISKNNLKKIFERYYRVEEQSIQFQGLGIGLFISSEIIERHHGKLWAESEPGKGSIFYFTLPISSEYKL